MELPKGSHGAYGVEDGTEVRTIRRARVVWKEGPGSLLVDLVVTESDQLGARPLEPQGNREVFIVDSDCDVLLEAEEIEVSPETGKSAGIQKGPRVIPWSRK